MLKELYELYKRLVAQGADLPVEGRSLQKISFYVVIRDDGSLVRIESGLKKIVTTKKNKKGEETSTLKFVSVPRMVLGKSKPSGSGLNPCFLFDNASYLFGYVDRSKCKSDADFEKEKGKKIAQFEESRRRHLLMEDRINSPSYSAVCRFFEQWDVAQAIEQIEELVPDKSIFEGNGLFKFQLSGGDYIHEDPVIQKAWDDEVRSEWEGSKNKDQAESNCLVTGKYTQIANLHDPSIKGYKGDKGLGAKLVTFNCKSFESYRKEQGGNAPISKDVAFGYCNALNYLIDNKVHRQFLGDTTMVFWTDAPKKKEAARMQGFVFEALNPSGENQIAIEAEDEHLVKEIKDSVKKLAAGCLTQEMINSAGTRFFMLGIAPNVSRLFVRFYCESSMGDFIGKIQQHYQDLRIQKRNPKFNEPDLITPFMILRETSRDLDTMPSSYGAALMKSILNNTPYPDAIAQAILRRIKVDKSINYVRAAFLKAWLIRSPRTLNLIKPNIMLDTNNTEKGYVLGRLFATLHKMQMDANPGVDLNRTIFDSCFAGASTSPRSIFPRLMKLHTHYLKKIKRENVGLAIIYSQIIGDILSMMDASPFPKQLSQEQQGLFSIAYYHQMREFFPPKKDK